MRVTGRAEEEVGGAPTWPASLAPPSSSDAPALKQTDVSREDGSPVSGQARRWRWSDVGRRSLPLTFLLLQKTISVKIWSVYRPI